MRERSESSMNRFAIAQIVFVHILVRVAQFASIGSSFVRVFVIYKDKRQCLLKLEVRIPHELNSCFRFPVTPRATIL
ncbi:hypothetical protein C7G41_31345 [Bradyrhizobium sp. MOS002]|nr:hypothetical protein C7G41_31345 [Bradyrhizobium sp. MOS002]